MARHVLGAFTAGDAILLAVMGFNPVGDAIRDALDPRMSRAARSNGAN